MKSIYVKRKCMRYLKFMRACFKKVEKKKKKNKENNKTMKNDET